MIYLDRKARTAFSVAFVQDHSEAVLETRIGDPAAPTGEWRFYFSTEPSDGVKRELSAILPSLSHDGRTNG